MKALKIVLAIVLCVAIAAGAVFLGPKLFTFLKDTSDASSATSVIPSDSLPVGEEIFPKTTALLNLTPNCYKDTQQLISELSTFESLQEVNAYNLALSTAQKNELVKAFPEVDFNWTVEIDGVPYNTKITELINFERKNLADRDDLDLFQYIPLFTRLKKVDMCGCGFTNEEMEEFVEAFPDVKFVWEITIANDWTLRTDAVAFSTFQTCEVTHRITSEEARPLKYCTDLVALDLGHNNILDLSFLQYMPNLKILILSDTMEGVINGEWRYIKDLSQLKYCPKLEYLEYFCNQVTDLSFLEYLPNLVDLNISWSPVSDYTYLKNLPNIERLYMMGTKIPHEHYLELQELYPNARIERYGVNSIDKEWRNHPRYFAMRDMLKNNRIHPLYE